jgi:NAD(P) transhydrogenase subunit alpha
VRGRRGQYERYGPEELRAASGGSLAAEAGFGFAGRRRKAARHVTELSLVTELTILVLSIFLGFEVIAKVPAMLHTPLMSGTNFIHGIVIVGAILVLGFADDTFTKVVGFVAIVLATANVVGGWFVTDRMLEMFKRRPGDQRGRSE